MNARNRNNRTGLVLLAVVIGMVVLSFASVPFYRIFCQHTGFGGTTQRAAAAPDVSSDRAMTVVFDAATARGMPWRFFPDQKQIRVRLGQKAMVFYTAENLSDLTVTGQATYNVTPDKAGLYFKKIQCFCFNQQVLKPHEKIVMPVLFFVDPALAEDRELNDTEHITLSYTFFNENKPGADAGSLDKASAAAYTRIAPAVQPLRQP